MANHLAMGPKGWLTNPVVRLPNKKPTKAELAERTKTMSVYMTKETLTKKKFDILPEGNDKIVLSKKPLAEQLES